MTALVQRATVIIASGAEYRQLDIGNLSRLHGVGVYYAATAVEAKCAATTRSSLSAAATPRARRRSSWRTTAAACT